MKFKYRGYWLKCDFLTFLLFIFDDETREKMRWFLEQCDRRDMKNCIPGAKLTIEFDYPLPTIEEDEPPAPPYFTPPGIAAADIPPPHLGNQ